MKGHDVIMSYRGMQTFETAISEKPDIALLEIRMLERDGIEILKRMKESARDIVIVMLTALKDEKVAKAVLKAGANNYITKPINYALLETESLSRYRK